MTHNVTLALGRPSGLEKTQPFAESTDHDPTSLYLMHEHMLSISSSVTTDITDLQSFMVVGQCACVWQQSTQHLCQCT